MLSVSSYACRARLIFLQFLSCTPWKLDEVRFHLRKDSESNMASTATTLNARAFGQCVCTSGGEGGRGKHVVGSLEALPHSLRGTVYQGLTAKGVRKCDTTTASFSFLCTLAPFLPAPILAAPCPDQKSCSCLLYLTGDSFLCTTGQATLPGIFPGCGQRRQVL
jgi:hypothetical protein